MNLFLLQDAVDQVEWSPEDPRTIHLKKVLRIVDGDWVDFGLVNGPRGKGMVEWTNSGAARISLKWKKSHPSDLLPISILVGLSRPQTCRKIIEQAAMLGVMELIFFPADKGEASYGQSSLWKDEWKRLLIKGAEQAFSCHLPNFLRVNCLVDALDSSRSDSTIRLALDLYEATESLSDVNLSGSQNIKLAIGPERGWSAAEREKLRIQGFKLCHMGERVLRVETAMAASVGFLSARHWANYV